MSKYIIASDEYQRGYGVYQLREVSKDYLLLGYFKNKEYADAYKEMCEENGSLNLKGDKK